MFTCLSPFQKATMQFKAVLEKENSLSMLIEELQTQKSQSEFLLEKLDRFFYVVEPPYDHATDFPDHSKPKPFIPYWCIISTPSQQKEKDVSLEILQNLPFFRAAKTLNNEKILEKMKHFLEQVVHRTNTLILIQHLKETLFCPENLIFPTVKDLDPAKPVEPKKQPNNKEINQKLDSRKTGFRQKTTIIAKTVENPSISQQRLKNYEVPLIYRRYFMIYFTSEKGKVLKSLLNYFFSNFLVENRNQTYVGLYEKEIYILSFDAKEYKTIENDENATKFEALSDEIIKNKKNCIELNIYSMNEINIDALNYFTKHIISAKTNEEIKLICISLMKNNQQIRLSKENTDYLLDDQQRKIYKFKIPEYIENMPIFLIYLRQNFLKKIFSHNTIYSQENTSSKNIDISEELTLTSKNSMYKKNPVLASHPDVHSSSISRAIDEENLFSSKNSMVFKKSVEIMVEKSDYCFLFNFLREVNGSAILLEQIFGWCIFLMFVSIR